MSLFRHLNLKTCFLFNNKKFNTEIIRINYYMHTAYYVLNLQMYRSLFFWYLRKRKTHEGWSVGDIANVVTCSINWSVLYKDNYERIVYLVFVLFCNKNIHSFLWFFRSGINILFMYYYDMTRKIKCPLVDLFFLIIFV